MKYSLVRRQPWQLSCEWTNERTNERMYARMIYERRCLISVAIFRNNSSDAQRRLQATIPDVLANSWADVGVSLRHLDDWDTSVTLESFIVSGLLESLQLWSRNEVPIVARISRGRDGIFFPPDRNQIEETFWWCVVTVFHGRFDVLCWRRPLSSWLSLSKNR